MKDVVKGSIYNILAIDYFFLNYPRLYGAFWADLNLMTFSSFLKQDN